MKIVNQFYYDYLLRLLESHFTDNKTPAKNSENIPLKIPEMSAEILNLLKELAPAQRQKLIKTWFSLNLPLSKDSLKQIVNLLNNQGKNSNPQDHALIKAFAILLKNKLPLLPGLIKGLAQNYHPEDSLSNKLNQYSQENTSIKENPLLKNLTINPELPTDRISEQLIKYPSAIRETLQLFKKGGSGKGNEIQNHLMGQQLLNQQDKNTLLALEIPLFSPNFKEVKPALLLIQRQSEQESQNDQEKSPEILKVSFLITLEKRGTIRADMFYSPGQLKGSFKSTNQETCQLLEKNLPVLVQGLEQMGFAVESPLIEFIDDQELDLSFQEVFPEGNHQAANEQFTHIDFKV